MDTIPRVQLIQTTDDVEVGEFLKETITSFSIEYTIVYEVVDKDSLHLFLRRCKEKEVLHHSPRTTMDRARIVKRVASDPQGRVIKVLQNDKGGFFIPGTKNNLKRSAHEGGLPTSYITSSIMGNL